MIFREEFFIALNNWQNGWGENQETRFQLAISLKAECDILDKKYKIVNTNCYRKRFLHKGELVDIIYNNLKDEGITSWTTDIRYAEFFKGKFRSSAVTAAIFEHYPNQNEVILNINELWQCNDFVSELEQYKAHSPENCNAIYHFKDIQGEVILEVPLRGSEICILSGISSPFDDICNSLNIPEDEKPKVFKQLIDKGAFIEEVTFIRDEAARNAITNTIIRFNELLLSLK